MREFLYNCELNDIYFLNGKKIEDETKSYEFYDCIIFKANAYITKELFHISKNKILLSNTIESFWEEAGFKVLEYAEYLAQDSRNE